MVQVNLLYPKIRSGEIDKNLWISTVLENNKFLDNKLLSTALEFLEQHPSVTKQDFFLSIETATILSELNMDTESVIVGLLLLAIHKNIVKLDEIDSKFDQSIGRLLNGVIKMDVIRNIQDGLENATANNHIINDNLKADQLRKMLLAMASDPRVVVIRLADHLCELRACRNSSLEVKEKLANETKLIYAPLANRLGIGQIKWELEDLAFRYSEPKIYKEIASLLDEKRIDRELYLADLIANLKQRLSEHNIKADISGRVKHIYSIWRKMQRKNIDYDELYDIIAVRVLTNNITDCYATLGMVHGLWRNIPKEFDDYIATPKENGYQSLHTAVIGPKGRTVEVQIRTHAMHNDSELGVAAHWRYKEGVAYDSNFDAKIAWLRQLIEWQDELTSASDLLDELKTNIEQERVYVLTPNGAVFDLPEGATPLDFAYHIHSDIGNTCRGAKVNDKMVPLTYTLGTGDKVEILTRNNSHPSRDWLNPHFNFLKTARAISKVKAWFKKQDSTHHLSDGKELLDRELQRLGIKHVDLQNVATKLHFKSENDLLSAIGSGDVKINQVVHAANLEISTKKSKNNININININNNNNNDDADNIAELLPNLPGLTKVKSSKHTKGIMVSGVDNLLTTLAHCCKPIPGNQIIGYIGRGSGVVVHCQDCMNIQHLKQVHPERLIEVNWGQNTTSGADSSFKVFAVDIFLESRDRQGLLRDVTGLLSAEKINIINLKTDTDKSGIVHTYVTIEVANVDMLRRILDRLQALPNVMIAKRISGLT